MYLVKSENVQTLIAEAAAAWSPPPRQTVTEWADQCRFLSPESSTSSSREKYRSSRVPYQVGIQDSGNEPGVHKVVVMTSAQVSKSTALENRIGYVIDRRPRPILLVLPTVEKGHEFSKERLAPMIRDTPALRDKVADAKSRDGDNTILTKAFKGGHLAIVGANAPAGLASRPRPEILGDEIDRFPMSAGTEGNPLKIAERRQANFFNRLIWLVSTPGNRATSLIFPEWENSDQRYYNVPCPHCGAMFVFEWEQMACDLGDDGRPDFSTSRIECPHCDGHIRDQHKPAMLAAGKWVATKPFDGVAGFHLWAAYSPWTRFREIYQEWWRSKDDPLSLKVFWNTWLGLPWDGLAASVEWEDIFDQREHFAADVPDGVIALFAGIDTQDDRFEVTVYGAGLDGNGWLIDHRVIPGDPSEKETREKLDDYIYRSSWLDASGVQYRILYSAVDTGGHRTGVMYEYCRARSRRGVIGIRGEGGENKPLLKAPVMRRAKGKKRSYRVWTVGVDEPKSLIYYRLQKTEEGARLHIPSRAPFDEGYCRGLTSEECVTEVVSGRRVTKWRLRPGRKRNEPLDCLVYALAAQEAWGKDLGWYQKQIDGRRRNDGGDGGQGKEKQTHHQRRQKARSKRWVDSWRS